MVYRSKGKKLVVWAQWGDYDNILPDLSRELQTKFGITPGDIVIRGRWLCLRPRLVALFPSKQAATAAESWIEDEFIL